MAAIIKVTPTTTRTIQKPIPIYSTPPAILPTATVKGVDIRRLAPIPLATLPLPAYYGGAMSPGTAKFTLYGAGNSAASWAGGGALIGGTVGCLVAGVPSFGTGCAAGGVAGAQIGGWTGAGIGLLLGGFDAPGADAFDWLPNIMITPWMKL